MTIYIDLETGAAYRIKDDEIEGHPLSFETNTECGATLLDLESDEWCPINPYDADPIPHKGSELTVGEFEEVIRRILTA